MKIGVLGCRGVPNFYGGFEQFAAKITPELVERGHEVWVYSTHNHAYKSLQWKGVNIIRCYDPENKTGAAGQFIYDLNCILDSRKRNFDILLQLGYTSSSVWHRLLPKNTIIVTNMDGMEWQRKKYSKMVRRFLKHAEQWAVKSSHMLIADAEPIRDYLLSTYGIASTFIPYGAEIFDDPNPEILTRLKLKPGNYFLVIARLQPDNHIEEIINGVINSKQTLPIVVVGNYQNPFGNQLRKRFKEEQVIFTGSIFDEALLNNLRYHCKLYFHGHSAGGTNPSLLEAMAANALICAHNNVFNRSVLGRNAFYFDTSEDIANLLNEQSKILHTKTLKKENLDIIKQKYSWKHIIDVYVILFEKSIVHKTR
jgi:glycosyltransferase involved in cell wall biosynthesis